LTSEQTSFSRIFRDELVNGEVFYSPREAQIVIKSWRRHYNRIRPHACAWVHVTRRGVDGSKFNNNPPLRAQSST
jgi:hypothetical protein